MATLSHNIHDVNYYNRYADGMGYDSPMMRIQSARISGFLKSMFSPKTHIDVGCALGLLVESMRSVGINSCGIDFSEYAIQNAPFVVRPHVSLGDIANFTSERKYDIATCIEVMEHIPEEQSGKALDNLCALSNVIYFTSTPYDTEEETHVNVRETEEWDLEFKNRGYVSFAGVTHYTIPWGRTYVKSGEEIDLQERIVYSKTRNIVQRRDKHVCIICGKAGIHVHEIIPRSAFGKNTQRELFVEKNMVCLCVEHHEQSHTREFRKLLLSTMSSKFGYEYNETQYQRYIGD